MTLPALLRRKETWIAAAGFVALLIVAAVLAARSFERSQARTALNAHKGFRSPALEVAFPRVVGNGSGRQRLEPGARMGLWTLSSRGGGPSFEVRLSERGRRWFSVVGNQVLATFTAGDREVTRVTDLRETFPTREVRFLYRWTDVHPGMDVLGENSPEAGKEYEGEALFSYDNGRWQIVHWTTPHLDEAVERFRNVGSAAGEH